MNMLREQVRADLLAFSRRPETLFFTVFLPVIFLVLFEAIFGGQLITLSDGTKVEQSTLQVPAFMTMGIISASFVALAITVVNRRETGTFKRVRGTPAPAWILIAGQVVTSLVIAFLMVLVMLVLVGRAFGFGGGGLVFGQGPSRGGDDGGESGGGDDVSAIHAVVLRWRKKKGGETGGRSLPPFSPSANGKLGQV